MFIGVLRRIKLITGLEIMNVLNHINQALKFHTRKNIIAYQRRLMFWKIEQKPSNSTDFDHLTFFPIHMNVLLFI